MILKRISREVIGCSFLFFLLVPLVFASNEVNISADGLEYDKIEGKVIAQGHVMLDWDNKKVFADYVEFLIQKKSMTALGNVTIEENGDIIHSESVVYNYDNETGEIKESFISSSNLLFMRSKSMNRLGKDTFKLKHVTFSTCDLDEPHTYFKSHCGKLILNKRVTIYNPIFYIGKIPVLYLPFITKSLKSGRRFSSRLKVILEPGYIKYEGFTLKTIVSCSLSDNSMVKVKYDHLGKRGSGYDGEFNYVTNGGMLNVDTYYTQDLFINKKRWYLRPNWFQRINNTWTLRSQGEFQSDNTLNNYYNQTNWDRTENNLRSFISFTRQKVKSSLNFNFEYRARYDNTKYEITSIEIPTIKWSSYQRELICGVKHKALLEYNNTYKKYETRVSTASLFYKSTAKFEYEINRSFKVGKRFTLTPGLKATENWYDKDNKNELKNAFFTTYGGNFNTRFRPTSWMDWNANYTGEARTKTDSLYIDTKLRDYGIVRNNIDFRNIIYVGDKTQVENRISYNLMHYRDVPSIKWSPLTTNITWIPKHYITAIFEESQVIDPIFKFNSLKFDLNVGGHVVDPTMRTPFFNFGLFYQHFDNPKRAYRNSRIDNIIGFGLWLNTKWRLDYTLRCTIAVNTMYSKLNEQDLKLYRDCHCYNLGIIYTKRPYIEEKIEVKFGMKNNMAFSKRSNNLGYDDDNPTEIFYPWRDCSWDGGFSL
jgi:LPS-assembly protein